MRNPRATQRAAATDESTPPDMATATTASAGTRSSGSAGTTARARAAAGHAAATVIGAGQPPATAGTIEISSRSPTGVSRPWLKRMSESLT